MGRSINIDKLTTTNNTNVMSVYLDFCHSYGCEWNHIQDIALRLTSIHITIMQRPSRFDFILDTVSSRHLLDPYLRSLKLDGTLCCLGIPNDMDFSPVLLTMGRRRLASSAVGGTLETQEMLDFCSKHNLAADVEIISAADIDDGFERLDRGEVRYRLVIDMATLNAPAGDPA